MSWRRVGLAALVGGVGVAVWRRMRIQTDPGPPQAEEDEGEQDETVSAVERPGAATVVGDPEIVLPESDDATAGTVQVDAVLGDPEIVLPESDDETSGTVLADAVLGDPEIVLPGSDDATEPEATTPNETAPSLETSNDLPRIVLPTMPQAGTRRIASEPLPAEPLPAEPPAAEGAASSARPDPEPPPPAPDAVALLGPLPGSPPPPPPAPDAVALLGPLPGSPPPPPPPPGARTGPTIGGPVIPPPPNPPRSRRRPGGWSIFGSFVLLVLVAATIVASVVKLPYYSLKPGSVYDTIERVDAPAELVSIPTGEIGFVTVSQTANITPWQWIAAKLDSDVRIRHEDEIRGDQTADELREADIRRMQVSKNAAVVVALRKLGYDLIITPIGIEVAQVFPCTAADGTLGTGDLIVGVDGTEVRDGEQLVAALIEVGIGEEVELLVERIDPSNPTQSMRTDLVNLTLGSADAGCLPDDVRAEEPRPFIGIGTLTIVEEGFPIEIDVRTGNVGGPSAGLAFTLAIIDVLSEGELTNGLNIVATGTIDRDGVVGPVGGIQQKTVAAERNGADVFIVPACCDNFVSRSSGESLDIPSNYDEAVKHADDMLVIGVNTIDDALVAIGELGGDVERFVN